MWRGLLIAGALALLGTTPAQALVVAEDGAPLSDAWLAAIEAADQAFPAAAVACPTVTVRFTEDDGGLTDTWAMWADRRLCVVGALPLYRSAEYATLCPVTVHEWGHLAGHGHSDDPNDPMFPDTAWPDACGPAATGADLGRDATIWLWMKQRRWRLDRQLYRCHGRRAATRCRRTTRRRLKRKARELRREWRQVMVRLRAAGETPMLESSGPATPWR